jgi:transcriptional repressor NrdR
MVRKNDGRVEPFNAIKLERGLSLAAPGLDAETISRIRTRIEGSIESKADALLSSEEIGRQVMEQLRTIDEMAYLRYAMVFQRLRSLDQVVDYIVSVEKPPEKAPAVRRRR